MADSVSESEVAVNPPPKRRRRILDPSAIVPVDVYSNKVSSSLQLKPSPALFTDKTDEVEDASLWSQLCSRGGQEVRRTTSCVVSLSDSEEEEEEEPEKKTKPAAPVEIRSPSPPPPVSPVQKQSRQVSRKISELDRRLRMVSSMFSSPDPSPSSSSRCPDNRYHDDSDGGDSDVIVLGPSPSSSPSSSSSTNPIIDPDYDKEEEEEVEDDDDVILWNPATSQQQQRRQTSRQKGSAVTSQGSAVTSQGSAVTSRQQRRQRRQRQTDRQKGSEVTSQGSAVTSQGSTVTSSSSSYSSAHREIPLKVRCRTDIHKIHVLTSTPLSEVVSSMSAILDVPSHRLLLMKQEVELRTENTVSELGLGIADIIECVVMAAEVDEAEAKSSGSDDIISVRLQSKDRDSTQEFSIHRDAPLGSVFSQFLSKMAASAAQQKKVRFLFDGSKVTQSQTPSQLDMEDGDIIEVWI